MALAFETEIDGRSLVVTATGYEIAGDLDVILSDRDSGKYLDAGGWSLEPVRLTLKAIDGRGRFRLPAGETAALYRTARVRIEAPGFGIDETIDWPPETMRSPADGPATERLRARGGRSLLRRCGLPGVILFGLGALAGAVAMFLVDRHASEAIRGAASAALAEARDLTEAAAARDDATRQREEKLAKQTARFDEERWTDYKDLAERGKALDDRQRRLDTETATLRDEREAFGRERDETARRFEARDKALEDRERADTERAAELAVRDKILDGRASALGSTETELRAREANIAQAERRIADDRKPLDDLRADLDRRQGEIAAGKAALDDRARGIDNLRDSLDFRKIALDGRESQLVDRNRQLEAKGADFEYRSANLRAREQELSERETEMARRTDDNRAVWGALALAPDGKLYAIANQVSEEQARDIVLAVCYAKSDAQPCKIKTTFDNACVAVARVDGRGMSTWSYDVRPHLDLASEVALNHCRNTFEAACSVRFSVCSPDLLAGTNE